VPVSDAADDHQRSQPEPWLVLVHSEVESADTVEPLRKRIYDYRHELRRKYQIPVLSLGLYLSVGLEGIGWDRYVESYQGQEIMSFRFPYLGLPGLEAFDYVTGTNLLGVGMSSLMRVAPDREAELKADALQRIFESDLPEFQRYLLVECVEAYLPLAGPQADEFDRRLLTPKYGGAMKVGKTSREIGVEEGERSMLIRTLRRRFGAIPPNVIERLQTMNPDELLDLNVRLADARSLSELGLEPEATLQP